MAKQKVTIKGIEQLERNLNREVKNIKGRTGRGMQAAGLFIKAKAKPLTPVDTGILINSIFHQVGQLASGPFLVVGYTAKYAPFVHEMPVETNWQKAGAENKFLQKAVLRNVDSILKIIARFAKI